MLKSCEVGWYHYQWSPAHAHHSLMLSPKISICTHFITIACLHRFSLNLLCLLFYCRCKWNVLKAVRWEDEPLSWHHYPWPSSTTDDVITCDIVYQWSYKLFMLAAVNGHHELSDTTPTQIIILSSPNQCHLSVITQTIQAAIYQWLCYQHNVLNCYVAILMPEESLSCWRKLIIENSK